MKMQLRQSWPQEPLPIIWPGSYNYPLLSHTTLVRAMEAVSYEEFEYKDLYQNASRAVAKWPPVYGYSVESRNPIILTYASVRGVAHEVPYTSPYQVLTLFRAFITVRSMEAVSYEEFEYKDLYQNASRPVGDDKLNWLAELEKQRHVLCK
ncbi:hypothetical protein KI387_002980 [Taxus chinensis]|uniref:Uncharacterized protein n=1 Tax=Taxus chinensis TaxID=29808 RepID=A0AA38GZW2_TAXCH|nr:hypothetical protein KI387_002980 [Taxus chinensis]